MDDTVDFDEYMDPEVRFTKMMEKLSNESEVEYLYVISWLDETEEEANRKWGTGYSCCKDALFYYAALIHYRLSRQLDLPYEVLWQWAIAKKNQMDRNRV